VAIEGWAVMVRVGSVRCGCRLVETLFVDRDAIAMAQEAAGGMMAVRVERAAATP